MYRWNIQPTLYIGSYNIKLNNNMMNISNIYVRITGYILQVINIPLRRKNNQHFMLAHNFSKTFQLTVTKKKYFQRLCWKMVYI